MNDETNTTQNDEATKHAPIMEKVRHEPDPNVPSDEYRIDAALVRVITSEPFSGEISMGLPKVANWKVDTAYVAADKEANLHMGYNPDFMRSLPFEHKVGVIIHEILHVAFGHITERAPANREDAKIFNIAADLAINSIIGENRLPEFCLMPGRAPKTDDPKLAALIENFPKHESTDYYFNRLKQFAESQGGKGGKGGDYELHIGNENGETLDSHGGWGDIPDELRDVLKNKTRELVEAGVKNAQRSANWGTIPAEMAALIEKMLRNELDWKAILRMFLGRTRSMDRYSTVKRINKRMPYLFPGVKRTTIANVLCAIDQSGSVGDNDVQRFLAETFAASKESQLDIINFDTEMDEKSLQSIKSGQNFKWQRTRCGGTDFDAVQRYVNDSKRRGKYSAVIIFTDGYAPKMGAVVGTKVMWVISETGDISAARPGDLVVKMGPEAPKTVHRA
jgi:predicted metal-dependent peptidase